MMVIVVMTITVTMIIIVAVALIRTLVPFMSGTRAGDHARGHQRYH
jgi:hypothetical protein